MIPRSRAARFTPRQGQYLSFIHLYTFVNGRPPAEADIQRYFGVTAPAVHSMIVSLEEHGLIARERRRARSIRVSVSASGLPPLAEGVPADGLLRETPGRRGSLGEGRERPDPGGGHARIAQAMGRAVIAHLFERYTKIGMDDSEFAPFIPCVAAAACEALDAVGAASVDGEALYDRLLEYALELYVAYCKQNDPEGADAREDRANFLALMYPGSGKG